MSPIGWTKSLRGPALAVLLYPAALCAQVPDPLFGLNGFAEHAFEDADVTPHFIRTLADGRIIVAGTVLTGEPGEDGHWSVACYLPDGTPDPSFDDDGYAVIDPSASNEGLEDLHVDADGNIHLLGYETWLADAPDDRGVLARLDAAGQMDLGFGTENGMLYYTLEGSDTRPVGLSALPGGGINVLSQRSEASNHALLARTLPSGQLDTGFPTWPIFSPVNPTGLFTLRDTWPTPDGGFYFCGTQYQPTSIDRPVLGKVAANGQFDPTFNGSGWLADFEMFHPWYVKMRMDLEGALLVEVRFTPADGWPMSALARYLPNGDRDMDFGLLYSGPSIGSIFHDFAVDASGRILIYTEDNIVLAYDAAGDLIPTFGVGGAYTLPQGQGNVGALHIQPDGAFLVARGSSNDTSPHFTQVGRFVYDLATPVGTQPAPTRVQLYPNPVAERLYVPGIAALPAGAAITDVQGRTVLQPHGSLAAGIDVSMLEPGLYYFRPSGEETGMVPFVKL